MKGRRGNLVLSYRTIEKVHWEGSNAAEVHVDDKAAGRVKSTTKPQERRHAICLASQSFFFLPLFLARFSCFSCDFGVVLPGFTPVSLFFLGFFLEMRRIIFET